MKRLFYKTTKFNTLYIDRILFETYLPLIFTCINDNNNIFICALCQDNEIGRKWLISQTDNEHMVDFINNKLSFCEILNLKGYSKFILSFDGKNYYESYHNDDWGNDSIYLPDSDFYINTDIDELYDDLLYFKNKDYTRKV